LPALLLSLWRDDANKLSEQIFHFSFFNCHFAIASADRLESGLVRLTRRGTSALSKRRVENILLDDK